MNSVLALGLALPLFVSTPDPVTAPPAASAAVTLAFDHTHAAWTELLRNRFTSTGFDYASLLKDSKPVDDYLAALAAVDAADFATWKREQQLAFWINAYNAYTLKRVLQSYPFEKVNELGADKKGPWDERFIPLGKLAPDLKQEKLTLNELENKILRPKFKDARIHAAINCAAESCPPLRPEAFVAERLDRQLDIQVLKWLGNPAFNRIDAAKNELQLSALFDWYKKDFVDEAGSVEAWIAKHGPKETVAWLEKAKDVKTTYFDYSWKLNTAR
ncbi:MAG: DUF547 domain-containing protein [Planctomycetes bacterium]|nr:DUF547 domain-containing protein [Planctomycetota bacterium]